MSSITLTRELAFASGQDAATRRAHAAGRKVWNEEDRAVAVETTNRLLRSVPIEQGGLMGVPEEMIG